MYSFNISHIAVIIVNSIILALMIKLQDVSCNCLVDWRNWFVVGYSGAMILLALIAPFIAGTGNLTNGKTTKKSKATAWQIILFVIVFSSIVLNIYALYSYTRDLEDSQCSCVAQRDAYLFGFVYFYIRISLIMLVCGLILTGITHVST